MGRRLPSRAVAASHCSRQAPTSALSCSAGVGANFFMQALAANPKRFPLDRFLSGWVLSEPMQHSATPSLGHRQLSVVFIIRVKRGKNDSAGAANDKPRSDDRAALAAANKGSMNGSGRCCKHSGWNCGKSGDCNTRKQKFSHDILHYSDA